MFESVVINDGWKEMAQQLRKEKCKLPRPMKKCLASLVSLGNQIKTTMRYRITTIQLEKTQTHSLNMF